MEAHAARDALFAVAGASSYAWAAVASGNPFLPLFNNVFRSDVLAPLALDDPRWHAGFGAGLPWSITFDTARYLEASNGGFGFVLVALFGAWLLALLRPGMRGAVIAATAIFLGPLMAIQYARYAYPGLALMLPMPLIAVGDAFAARGFAAVVGALCALNVAFQANSSWLLQSVARKRFVTSGGESSEVFRRFAPERMLIAHVRARDPGDSIVLALDPFSPAVAELAGRGRTVASYDPALAKARAAAESDSSGEHWRSLLAASNARWLLLTPERTSAALQRGLSLAGATRVEAIGSAELWTIAAPSGIASAPKEGAAR